MEDVGSLTRLGLIRRHLLVCDQVYTLVCSSCVMAISQVVGSR